MIAIKKSEGNRNRRHINNGVVYLHVYIQVFPVMGVIIRQFMVSMSKYPSLVKTEKEQE